VRELGRARGHALARLTGRADPREIALHVGREDRAAGGRGLLGDELERARLPRPGRPAIKPWRLRKPSGSATSTAVPAGSAPAAANRRPMWMRGPSNP
jgi:hypothetical protein